MNEQRSAWSQSDEQLETAGREMYAMATRMFPICRSITGNGVRQTLDILSEVLPIETTEVATGTQVFDWKVPKEWSIRDAYIKDQEGRRLVDFRQSNLHVVSGSTPVQRTMKWSELKKHVHSLPDQPALIPYRTNFHSENWGFCMSHKLFEALDKNPDQALNVRIDSSLEPGHLTIGEVVIPGQLDEEVLISTHICHPSLANDNLAGIAVAARLAMFLQQQSNRYTYRFAFIPATIGAITWLSLNESTCKRIRHGLVLAVLGDSGNSTYRRSRQGDAEIDRVAELVLRQSQQPHSIQDFVPFVYDQRQFCSPGFNLPIGSLMRTPNEEYKEYHTSADNLDFIHADRLADSWQKCLSMFGILERNRTLLNLNPKCEPRLGERGLYKAFGQAPDMVALQHAVLWTLNLSDGEHSLLDIAERSGINFSTIDRAAMLLEATNLVSNYKECDTSLPTATKSPTIEAGTDYSGIPDQLLCDN